jgi:hypothetical protein
MCNNNCRHLKESLRPQFSFEEADIANIHIQKACREFSYKINRTTYISYRRDFSIYRKKDVLFQLKITGTSEKFKNQTRPLFMPRSVNFRQHFRNLSSKTVPLTFCVPQIYYNSYL